MTTHDDDVDRQCADYHYLENEITTLKQQRDDLLEALKENYEFTKYAAAVKRTNTDEYLNEFFDKGEVAQKLAKAAIAKCEA